MAHINCVDVSWLSVEAVNISGSGTPVRPAIVGGCGALGSNLLALLAQIHECEQVIVFDKRPPSTALLKDMSKFLFKVKYIQLDLGPACNAVLTSALTNVDCVFTCITPDVQFGTEQDFFSTNVEGVKSIIKACKLAGVPRLVHMSSIAVTNHFVHSFNQCEAAELPPIETYSSPYDISKRLGEEEVLQSARKGEIAACSIRAGGILSSHCDFVFRYVFQIPGILLSPSAASVAQCDYIDVRDVVRALVIAAKALTERQSEVSGEAFFVTKGEAWKCADFGRIVAKDIGYPYMPIPRPVLTIARWCSAAPYFFKKALGCKVPGIPPQTFITMAYYEQTFNNSKAKRVLGYFPKVLFEDTLKRTAALHLEDQRYVWSFSCLFAFTLRNRMLHGLGAVFALLLSHRLLVRSPVTAA